MRAYTLVELLIAMAIIASVGGIILSIFFLSLRGSIKTDTVTVVRQNGNNAISQMARIIRDARRFDDVSTDGFTWQNNCIQPQANPPPPPAQYQYVRVTSSDPGQSTLICKFDPGGGLPLTIASSSAPLPKPPALTPTRSLLLDTSVVTLNDCYFTCYQETAAQNPVIGIHFDLSSRTTSGFVEGSSSLPFATSVTLRNKD